MLVLTMMICISLIVSWPLLEYQRARHTNCSLSMNGHPSTHVAEYLWL